MSSEEEIVDAGQCGDRRRTDPAHVAVCGRTRCDALYRRCRRSFFSPPHERDEPSAWLTEQSLDTLQGTKTREGIRVRQSAALWWCSHPHIMPTFRSFSMSIEPYENRLGVVIRPLVLPIRNREDPKHLDRPSSGRLNRPHRQQYRLPPRLSAMAISSNTLVARQFLS